MLASVLSQRNPSPKVGMPDFKKTTPSHDPPNGTGANETIIIL